MILPKKHVSLVFLIVAAAMASAFDIVILKNGKELECHVLKFADGRFTVRDADGNIREGNASSIESIAFEAPPPRQEEQALAKNDPEMEEIDFEISGTLGAACQTPEQKLDLARFAAKTFEQPINSIQLSSTWGHPMDRSLAAVKFERIRMDGDYYRYAMAYIYHQDLPPKYTQKDDDGNVIWGPQEGDAVSGPWFTDKKLVARYLVRYQLKRMEKYLPLPDRFASYDVIHKLLLSIEAKEYEIGEALIDTPLDQKNIELEKVCDVGTEKEKDTLRYQVYTVGSGFFVLEHRDGKFVLVGWGWAH